MPAYKIYISSTYRNLIEDRALLRLRLDQAQYTTVCMEKYPPALSQHIKSKCEDDVRCCDIYIGIIGDSYGSLARDEAGNELSLSYTEYEYEAAVASNKKRLVFFKQMDKKPEDPRLVSFIDKIKATPFFTGSFNEINELAAIVLASLVAETGENQKRNFSSDLKYFCNRNEQASVFNNIFFTQKASSKIHFFLLPGHEFNGHRAFIERYKSIFKKNNRDEEPVDISFNVKLDAVTDEIKIKETIKELIANGLKSRFNEQLPKVTANNLFKLLQKVHKKILFIILNIQSSYIKESFADLYKKSIEKFYQEFSMDDEPAFQDMKIIIFLNLKYLDNAKNLEILDRTFTSNEFYADKKLPNLDNINEDDITEWLEFNDIEKKTLQAKKLLQKQITQIDDASYEELTNEGIYMDEAEQLMESIIEVYNLKKE
jgi:hypothetical protein